MPTKTFTLIYIKSGRQVLLGYKKRGIFVDLWSGYGGKIIANESIYESAKRELKEESNLDVDLADLNHLGVVIAYRNDKENIVHIFTTTTTSGVLQESDEMAFGWFDFNQIPYDRMLPDCRFWYPLMLDDKKFTAKFWYDGNGHLIDLNIEVHE